MNQALFPASASFATRAPLPISRRTSCSRREAWASHDEAVRLRRLRSLLGLFSLYAVALLAVLGVSDGADVGCILAGVAGHVLYATHRILASWHVAACLEHAKLRHVAG